MESNAFDFVSIFDIIPIPGLVIDFAHEHKIIRYANKAFLENAEIDIAAIETQKIHDVLNHIYLIDDKGEHIELDEVLQQVFEHKTELNLFMLRTSEQNGFCRLEDNFNRIRISNLVLNSEDNSMCISLFFHKGGIIPFQETTNSSILETINCTVNETGIITSVDNISSQTWGYSADELVGKILVNLLPNESRIYSWELFVEKLKKTHTVSTDRTMYLKDRSIIPVNFTAVWDEEKQIINGNVKDLRKKSETEYELVMNEHRLKSLLKEGVDLIAIVDSEGKFIYLSPNFEKYLKSEIHSYLGVSAFEFIHPEDQNEIEIEFRQAMTINRIQSSPSRIEDKNGRIRWFEKVCTKWLNDL